MSIPSQFYWEVGVILSTNVLASPIAIVLYAIVVAFGISFLLEIGRRTKDDTTLSLLREAFEEDKGSS